MEFEIREITPDDINQDFFETLKNLSDSLNEDIARAREILKEIKDNPYHRVFTAISKEGKVVGLTTLLIERKFIEDFGKFGHIEDVVVKKGYERHGVGSLLVKTATEKAREMGCYQVRVCCSKVKFYERLGYKIDGKSMIIDLKE
jgi:glucosamine-phosphate N-acetyltransferase